MNSVPCNDLHGFFFAAVLICQKLNLPTDQFKIFKIHDFLSTGHTEIQNLHLPVQYVLGYERDVLVRRGAPLTVGQHAFKFILFDLSPDKPRFKELFELNLHESLNIRSVPPPPPLSLSLSLCLSVSLSLPPSLPPSLPSSLRKVANNAGFELLLTKVLFVLFVFLLHCESDVKAMVCEELKKQHSVDLPLSHMRLREYDNGKVLKVTAAPFLCLISSFIITRRRSLLLFRCLFVCFVCLCVCLCVCLFMCLFCLCVCLFCVFVCLFVCLFFC